MSAPVIDDSTLIILAGTGEGFFSHDIKKCRVPDMVDLFYRKEMEYQVFARIELLAQEFFRLILPWQPQTFISHNVYSNTYFVLSQAVPGFKSLPRREQQAFNQGRYPGLGQVLLISVFLQEIDLKCRNIGLNKQGHVIKIDGDWCFAAIKDYKYSDLSKNITSRLIDFLPFPIGYTPFNWLDIYELELANEESSIVNMDLTNAPHFRAEINEAILKILVLSEEYIKQFVYAFIPISLQAEVFIKFLIERRAELQYAALQNASFKNFILNDASRDIIHQHVPHMANFMANGSYFVITGKTKDALYDTSMRRYKDLVNRVFSLQHIIVDYSSCNSTEDCMAYRDHLLNQVFNWCSSISSCQNGLHAASYVNLIDQAEKKIDEINAIAKQLEPKFLFLDRINYAIHLDIFAKKKTLLYGKSLTYPHYQKGADAAHLFYNKLREVKKSFLAPEVSYEQAKNTFKKQSIEIIAEAKMGLIHHREWIGVIRKFLVDLITFFSRGVLSHKLSLFAKTDSSKKLDAFQQHILSIPN